MALPYYVYQDNRKNGTNLWYAKATSYGTVTLDDLADEIQTNCSLKKSDCLAVNAELLQVIKNELSNSNCVYLDGFGYFKTAIHGKGASSEKDYTPQECVKQLCTNFVPSYGYSNIGGSKTYRCPWTEGITLKRVEKNT